MCRGVRGQRRCGREARHQVLAIDRPAENSQGFSAGGNPMPSRTRAEKRGRARLLALAAALAAGAPATGRAAPSCQNITVSNLAFGAYNPFHSAPLDSAGTISYDCPPPLTPVVSMSRGAFAGSYSPRIMLNFSSFDVLAYNVYQDAARTIVWGDGTGGTRTLSAPRGSSQSVTFYGRVPPGQDVSPGSYFDFLTVTFNF
jgi:spore coat protein U-like protein